MKLRISEVQTLESSLHSLKKNVKSEQPIKPGYKKELDDVKMTAEILLGSEEDKKPVLKANSKNAFSNDDLHVLMIAILIKQSKECSIIMKNQLEIPTQGILKDAEET